MPFTSTSEVGALIRRMNYIWLAFCCIEEHGIIHRDIREGNILIDYSGVVKVIDFGIGKIFKKNEKNQDDSLVSKINRAGLDVLPIEYYDAISCFVECGYKYHVNRIIYMQTVTDFVKWFEGYSLESQKLILRNFATKLSTIKLIKPEVEIPF